MNKIRVRIEENRNIYIHNDLASTAYYFKKRLDERIKNDDREGISLELMAALTMIAFTVEARFNFLGFKLIDKWDEWQGFMKKVESVSAQLGIDADFTERPYKTIQELKEFRNTLAHGKPLEIGKNTEIVTTHEELEARGYLTADWEKFVTKEFFDQSYEDMDKVWKLLLDQSDLEIFDTMTGGSHSISFIEHVNADASTDAQT